MVHELYDATVCEKSHTVPPITAPTTLSALARASALAMVANAAPGCKILCS